MVFYRKYRPQTIKELDSGKVRELLTSVLTSKEVPHAFLFTGPKGLGKTSTARILAKVVNCEKEGLEPCNKCDHCKSITNGANVDVLEIDGASNRGIDEIRDLREKVRLSPAGSKKKVYIIDEVHMLTTEAFNALLKTLEEPPNHVIFVLCTTESHKVPGTILSRCFHIPFKKANKEELIRSFERIVAGENMNIEKDALSIVASFSDGSFRDGAKVLEEVKLAFGNKKITKDLIESKFQIQNIESQIIEMLKSLSEKNTNKSIGLISKLVDQGIDIKYFIDELISKLHSLMLVRVGVLDESEIKGVIVDMSVNEIKKLVDLLTKAHGELRYAVLSQMPLEMAVIEWGMEDGKDLLRPLDESSGPTGNTRTKVEKATLNTAARNSKPGSDDDMKTSSRGEVSPSAKGDAVGSSSREDVHLSNVGSTKVADGGGLWQKLIDAVKKQNHSVAGVLRGCSLGSYDNKTLIIETNYKFHKERLDDRKNIGIIENAWNDMTGDSVKASIVLKGGDEK